MSMLYVRDLKENLQEEVERDIRKNRPDLVAALEDGQDILIGDIYKASRYEIA